MVIFAEMWVLCHYRCHVNAITREFNELLFCQIIQFMGISMLRHAKSAALMSTAILLATSANATLISLGDCDASGAFDCVITNSPPNPVAPNPNDGILLAWDEMQNITLDEPLFVERVFDETADFVTPTTGGFLLDAGTIVSSHYLQWDPGNGSSSRVTTTISLDSQAFAFITSTSELADTDSLLGLPGLDYNDFGLRGLESGDTTDFSGSDILISWSAGSPGDWTRLISAFSPGGEDPVDPIPLPASLPILLSGLLGLFAVRRRRRA